MPKALIFCGPTAVGKTKICEQIAKNHKLPIISCDSRQIYKELGIAVAKPEQSSLDNYKYYEINSCSIFEEQNLQRYCERVKNILENEEDVLICGGTGFYLKALLDGMEKLPAKNPKLRERLEKIFNKTGIEGLQKEYQKIKNPIKLKDTSNPQRLIRAIEIGEKEIANEREPAALEGYETKIIILNRDREQLYERINSRVEEMIENNLVNEVKGLLLHKDLNALQTVGYKEIFSYLESECTLEQALEELKKNTRRYAKRQITYFKNQFKESIWMNPEDSEKINTFAKRFLQ